MLLLSMDSANANQAQTLFSFPARHHPLPPESHASLVTAFKPPTGMHPVLELSFPTALLRPPRGGCGLHAYLTLPSYLFIDRYQLSDPLFLASHNLKGLRALSGATDLEAPDWVIDAWGSAALLEIAEPPATSGNREWTVSIPLHLRYLAPGSETPHGKRLVPVPWPTVFWACTAEEGLKFASSPFDRINLGFDGLFGPRTLFYQIPQVKGSEAYTNLDVPILDANQSKWVETGTVVFIVFGTLWVTWTLFRRLLESSKMITNVSKSKKTS